MNTRILLTGALALPAVAGAYAQSAVTIYGRLDLAVATFDRTRGGTDRNNMMNSDTGSSTTISPPGPSPTSIVPPWACTMRFASVIPSPVPRVLVV